MPRTMDPAEQAEFDACDLIIKEFRHRVHDLPLHQQMYVLCTTTAALVAICRDPMTSWTCTSSGCARSTTSCWRRSDANHRSRGPVDTNPLSMRAKSAAGSMPRLLRSLNSGKALIGRSPRHGCGRTRLHNYGQAI
jgi:hypothetical protein